MVDLTWNGGIPYDYPTQYGGVYATNSQLSVNGETYDSSSPMLGSQQSYIITLTPFGDGTGYGTENTLEIFKVDNNGFAFSRPVGLTMFSYNTSGFLSQATMNRMGVLT